ncbi:MAG TPA: hypothetical protein PL169_04165 [Leptospiraceae bacterium]|nr:hypothetical protein [Leptospiraceae bacterium]
MRTMLILFFFSFCSDIKRPPLYSFLLSGGGTSELAGVISSDFGAGGRFTAVNADLLAASPSYASVHSDAVFRYFKRKVYIVNRLNRDSILILNRDLGFLAEKEFSVGAGTNPQDILAVSDSKAYVPLYGSTDLLTVDLGTGFISKRIYLGNYSESFSSGGAPDGKPEMHTMIQYGSSAYLILQRLDRNDLSGFPTPSSSSYLLEMDINTDAVKAVYTTPAPNPLGKMKIADIFGEPHIIINMPGRLGFQSRLDGGIGAFSLNTKTFRQSFLLSEQTAGGDIMDFVIKSQTVGYAYVLDSSFNKFIVRFNPENGTKSSILLYFPSSAGNIGGMALSKSGKLYIGDSSFSKPGVTVYNTDSSDQKLTPVPIDVGLRPYDISVLED